MNNKQTVLAYLSQSISIRTVNLPVTERLHPESLTLAKEKRELKILREAQAIIEKQL